METLIHPQFLTDGSGQKTGVYLPMDDFDKLLDEMEDLEDGKAFLQAKEEDDGGRILFSDYLKTRQKDV